MTHFDLFSSTEREGICIVGRNKNLSHSNSQSKNPDLKKLR